MRRRLVPFAALLALPLLQGCLAVSAVSAVGTVAAVTVKTGAKVAGGAVGLAADGVGAVGHTVTGTGHKDSRKIASAER